jgi:hypothetical protein
VFKQVKGNAAVLLAMDVPFMVIHFTGSSHFGDTGVGFYYYPVSLVPIYIDVNSVADLTPVSRNSLP